MGQTARIQKARTLLNSDLDETKSWLLERVGAIPTLQVNRYEFLITIDTLQAIIRELDARLKGLPATPFAAIVAAAYEEGTLQSVTNLSGLTQRYTSTMQDVIASDPYQRRIALVGARQLEEMAGFAGDTATDLSRTLMRAVQDGISPYELREHIVTRFDVASSRAERIARTEVTTALRRARWDENEDARDRLGINTALLHLSALSPTTRATHAARHYHVYTPEEERAWYAINGNSINCKCAQTEVLLDENGNVMSKKIRERMKAFHS